jgi:hypothetical protein
LRLEDLRAAERRVFITEGKAGRQRLIPVSGRFFTAVAAYLDAERPPGTRTDRVFVVLKGPHRGQPLSAKGMDEILTAARRRAGLAHATCHELRHTCLTQFQPRHEPGSHRRHARPPQPRHDSPLRQDRQPHRRRRVLRRHRESRSPLRTATRPARRRHRAQDGPAAPRAPPDARQRLLHPARRTGLRLRVHLRTCTFFQTGIAFAPPCKPSTTTPSPNTKTTADSYSPSLLARIDQDAS